MRNLVANLLDFTIQTAIALLLTPYLIRHLGWAAYGLIPLTNMVVSYAGVITSALSSAVNRFMTVAVERGDIAAANRVFNTSLVTNFAVVAALVCPAILCALSVDRLFSVPAASLRPAQALFLGSVTLFLLTTLATSFDAVAFCRNRFDAKKFVTVIAQLLGRVIVVIALFRLAGPSLTAVGLGLAVTGAVTFVGAVVMSRLLLPEVRFSTTDFSWATLHSLAGPALWIALNQVGTLLLLSVDLVIVNLMFGAVRGGQYAALAQWSAYLRALGLIVASTFAPTIIALSCARQATGLGRLCALRRQRTGHCHDRGRRTHVRSVRAFLEAVASRRNNDGDGTALGRHAAAARHQPGLFAAAQYFGGQQQLLYSRYCPGHGGNG